MAPRLTPAPARSPALGAVAPFIVAAPLALAVAGLLAATASDEVFFAINAPRLVAMTHAVVLGWITATMMGATYQLGPVVLGGSLLSTRLARVQFIVHAGAVGSFVWFLLHWDIVAMSAASAALVVSLILYLVNSGFALARAKGWSLPRTYLVVSCCFLAVTGGFGITYVGALQHMWFPITLGRLASHAHLGLVGWLALTLMGVSYQLVPMFSVATRVVPRFGRWALATTAVATGLFAALMLTDPPADVRLLLALLLAAGPLLWAVDQWRILRGRNRRRLDIHGRATFVSLGFLLLAVVLGAGAAIGTPFTPDHDPARWTLAYAIAAILGWAGTAVIGNGVKITAFLVWIHRYQPRAGTAPVPLLADLYSDRLATAVLALHALATLLLAAAALAGNLVLFHTGAAILAASATANFALLASIFIPRHASTRVPRPQRGVPA